MAAKDDDFAAAPWGPMASSARPVSVASLGEAAIAAALPALCDTGRFGLAGEGDELTRARRGRSAIAGPENEPAGRLAGRAVAVRVGAAT